MKTKSYIFAGIIAAITMGNAYATGENTVTSKSYVDAMDATKQNKIPIAGTNASEPGESVVTYTDTAGTIGERGIFDPSIAIDNQGQLVSGHEGDLMPADQVVPVVNDVYNNITNMNKTVIELNAEMNAETRESIGVSKLTCANQDCTLYQVNADAGIAHKLYSCTAQTVAADCPACGTGTIKECVNGICECVYAECLSNSDCIQPANTECLIGLYGCKSDHKCGCVGSVGQ